MTELAPHLEDTDPEQVIRSLVQSFDARSQAEPLIGQEVTQELVALIANGEINDDQAEEVLFRLGLFHRTEGDSGF